MGSPGSMGTRVWAVVLRHLYLLRASWPRVVDIVYWQVVQTFMWGFLQTYVQSQAGISSLPNGALLGAVLLWDVLFRGQNAFTTTFLEEIWSKNIVNFLISPMRVAEMVMAMMVVSIIRIGLGLIAAGAVAWLAFGFNPLSLGMNLFYMVANLTITGWSIGLIAAGIVLRNGLGAQGLASSLTYLLLPLSCVYYPLSVLPDWVQMLSGALPPTYVFEALRAGLGDDPNTGYLLARAFQLNVVWLSLSSLVFWWFLSSARASGALVRLGE